MSQQSIIAYFDSRSDAMKAKDALVQFGISAASIRILPETEASKYKRQSGSSYDYRKDEGGFWASLANFFLPDEDRYSYAEGMSRGGATMSVTTDESNYSRVSSIVERSGAANIDEREAAWRREGWTGHSPKQNGSTAVSSAGASTGTGTDSTPRDMTAMMINGGPAAALASDVATDEVIPVIEEQLQVGKREIETGRVRIRSYVVETPVQEQIRLRQEHIHVERRPSNRILTAADEGLFRERAFEVLEKAEEAVIAKQARVTEEIVIRKDVGELAQTVQETLRRTEVEVDDQRVGNVAAQGDVAPALPPQERGADLAPGAGNAAFAA